MHPSFNELIDSYIDDKIGTAENFLSPLLTSQLAANLNRLYAADTMVPAGTGNSRLVQYDQLVRSDKICWLDPSHEDAHEAAFFLLMDAFVLHLNETCYTGITGYEFHYALYESGSFYKKHLDQFRNNSSRKFSMIMYLNPDWQTADGGELCIYTEAGTVIIAPERGKSVFFRSDELPHEVLLAHKRRMSITGWLLGS